MLHQSIGLIGSLPVISIADDVSLLNQRQWRAQYLDTYKAFLYPWNPRLILAKLISCSNYCRKIWLNKSTWIIQARQSSSPEIEDMSNKLAKKKHSYIHSNTHAYDVYAQHNTIFRIWGIILSSLFGSALLHQNIHISIYIIDINPIWENCAITTNL